MKNNKKRKKYEKRMTEIDKQEKDFKSRLKENRRKEIIIKER